MSFWSILMAVVSSSVRKWTPALTSTGSSMISSDSGAGIITGSCFMSSTVIEVMGRFVWFWLFSL